jgi:hypothetical protein
LEDQSIQRNSFAGPDEQAGPNHDLARRNFLFPAVVVQNVGYCWRHRHQRFNRAPRPPDAPRLQCKGQCEQEGDCSRFEPFPNGNSAADRERHQKVHVRPETSNSEPRLWKHKPRTGKDGQCIQHLGENWKRMRNTHPL